MTQQEDKAKVAPKSNDQKLSRQPTAPSFDKKTEGPNRPST